MNQDEPQQFAPNHRSEKERKAMERIKVTGGKERKGKRAKEREREGKRGKEKGTLEQQVGAVPIAVQRLADPMEKKHRRQAATSHISHERTASGRVGACLVVLATSRSACGCGHVPGRSGCLANRCFQQA